MSRKNSELCDLADRAFELIWEKPFEQLTKPEQVFIAIWGLEADVNNGGFDQYYFNSAGDTAWFAPAALTMIGAHKAASIVQRANDLFPSGAPSPQRESRWEQLDRVDSAMFDALDREFYSYPDDLAELLHTYVLANIENVAGADGIVSAE